MSDHLNPSLQPMKTFTLFAGSLLPVGYLLVAASVYAAQDDGANWPQWRGPLATGAAPEASPPLEWSETKNVKWRAAIPGEGASTPAEYERWRKATDLVDDEWMKEAGNKGANGKALYDDAVSLLKKYGSL